MAVTVSFATRASRLMSGGVIPASTGRNVVSVGRMHPEVIRIVSFSATSSFLVWYCGTKLAMHTQRHCTQGLSHPSAASRCTFPAGASQTAEETVPGVHFALEAFEMFFVCQGPVESHTKVHRVVIVRKRRTVHKYIKLSMCVPVIRRCLSSAQFQTPAAQILG